MAQDKEAKQKVREYNDDLKNLMNLVKAFAQRQQEQAQKQNGNGQPDPAAMAKIQATILTAKNKSQLAAESHAQKTAQRQIAFEQQLQQDAQRHKAELVKTDLESAATIRRGKMKSLGE